MYLILRQRWIDNNTIRHMNNNIIGQRPVRRCTKEELELIEALAKKANYNLEPNWMEKILAQPIDDVRIGSIRLINISLPILLKRGGRLITDSYYYDADGTEVCVYLLIDSNQNLCELDMWKVDNSEILEIASPDSLLEINTK